MTNPDEFKDGFYDDLDCVISATPRTDKPIVLVDFNARVGTDYQTWEGVLGTEEVAKCNSNGLLPLRKCAVHELLITNTGFRLPTRNKTSLMHLCSKHWHLTDYVIVRRKDGQDVWVTKIMCGAYCWTDHRFVVNKLNLCIYPVRQPQGKKVPKRLMKSNLLQTERIWRSSLMHLTVYGPQSSGTTTLLSADELFWLTKKRSWIDGLNTLMVFLIGHYLSMMKLSTDYHRWNVIRRLMSSQPSLKQWKQ